MSVGRGRPAPGAVPVSPGRRPCSRGPEDSGAPAALPIARARFPRSTVPVAPSTWAAGERRTDPNRVVDDRAAPAGRRCATAAVGGRPSSFRWRAAGRRCRWSVERVCRRRMPPTAAATRGVTPRAPRPWSRAVDRARRPRCRAAPDPPARPAVRTARPRRRARQRARRRNSWISRDRVADQLTEQCVADQRPAPRRSADRHGSARVGGGGRRCVHLSRGTGPRGRGGTEFGWCGVRPPDGLRRLGGESPRPPAGARRAARVTRVGPGAVGAVRGRRRIRR